MYFCIEEKKTLNDATPIIFLTSHLYVSITTECRGLSALQKHYTPTQHKQRVRPNRGRWRQRNSERLQFWQCLQNTYQCINLVRVTIVKYDYLWGSILRGCTVSDQVYSWHDQRILIFIIWSGESEHVRRHATSYMVIFRWPLIFRISSPNWIVRNLS